jgi:ABC-type transporter Mla subunit MlaD
MTLVELVTLVGNVITEIDSTLSDPSFDMSDPRWQALYALRKHLDDLQRSLVQATIQSSNAAYQELTGKIANANDNLQQVIDDITKVDTVINDVSKIASFVDQVLKMKP